jgi:hypothetical protein
VIDRRELVPTRAEVVDGGFALALMAIALWAFESSYGGSEFWMVGVTASVVALIVLHLCGRFGLGPFATGAVWFGVYVTVGGVLADRDEALLGLLPSIDTVRTAVTVPVEGWKQLLTTVPPVGDGGGLLTLPVFLGLFATAASYAIARRRTWPLWPSAPAAAALALGILVGTLSPVSVVLHGAVFSSLVLAWASIRSQRARTTSTAASARRLVSMAVLVAVAALAGLLVAPSLPMVDARERTVWRDTFDPPFDPSVYPSPLGYYRQYVKELEAEPMFEVAGLPEGVPIRMATLDDYDGIVWKVSGGTRALPGSAGYFQRVGTDVEPQFDGTTSTVTVTLPVDNGYDEVWLPTVGEVRSLEFLGSNRRELGDAFRYNTATDTAAVLADLEAGDSYTLEVSSAPSIDDLADDAVFGENTLDPIESVDGAITGLGSGLVEDVDGIERVRILVDFLRAEGFYSDAKEDGGQVLVPPGHGVGRLSTFADSSVLVGNAEQYAATLGLILRNSGIPARVVMGFVPETWNPDGTVTITGNDAEAWVEFLVDGVGWVAAYPTPDRTKTTIQLDNTPRPIPDRETQVPPPPPVVQADAETEPAGESTQTERKKDEEEDEDEPVDGGVSWVIIAAVVAVALPILLVAGVVLAIRFVKSRRRRRRQRQGREDERIANGWRELIDYTVDVGRELPIGATRREAASLVGVAAAPSLAERADHAVFSGDDGRTDDHSVEVYWQEVTEAKRSLRSELSTIERWKADLSLESIRRDRRARAAERRRKTSHHIQ